MMPAGTCRARRWKKGGKERFLPFSASQPIFRQAEGKQAKTKRVVGSIELVCRKRLLASGIDQTRMESRVSRDATSIRNSLLQILNVLWPSLCDGRLLARGVIWYFISCDRVVISDKSSGDFRTRN